MMSAATPMGRADVLAYRIAERAVRQFENRSGVPVWDVAEPHVRKAVNGLGVLPLAAIPLTAWILGAVAATGIGFTGGAIIDRETQKAKEYEAWKKTVPDPKPGPAPVAPQTAEDMLTWNPDKAAKAQKSAFDDWKKTAMDSYADVGNFGNPKTSGDGPLYAALALLGVSLLLAMKD